VDISVIIASAIEDAVVMGPNLQIEQNILPQMTVQADPDLLELVIQNLTSNAVK
jgi:signal transduction histidine kinase